MYSETLDLVPTCLVMVKKSSENWNASMAEPIILSAGLNYLADQRPQLLINFFASKLFSPIYAPNLTPQERGHTMELVIALRFMQGWWLEPELKKYLPDWVNELKIPKPIGVMDCRKKEPVVNPFVQQLNDSNYPYLLFPSAVAGPDLRYSIFCCYIKTSSTSTYSNTVHVRKSECDKNISTMHPSNWYKSKNSVKLGISSEQKFIHMRFELPDTAPSLKDSFISKETVDGYVICVNLESGFARDFFGKSFVDQYGEFVSKLFEKLGKKSKMKGSCV